MSPIAMQILERLADVSVRLILLAAIAWPAAKLVRSAAARHGTWCALLAGMLTLPILAPLLPPIRSALVTRYAPPFAGFDVSAPKVSPARSASRTAPITLPPQEQQPRWATLLLCIYLAMLLALLTRFALAYRFSRSLVRKSLPIRDEHPLNLMEDLAGAQSMPWPLPQLRTSHDVVVPVTLGWRDPVILLPVGWQGWDAWKLNAVLAHELAHIRRADWLVTVAASLNRALFWFHPLAWWLERHLSALSEQACDEAALRTVSDAPSYARAVLEFAAALQSGRRLACGVAMARTAKVSRRIDRILELRTPGPGIMKKSAWIAVLACALPLVYGAAALQVGQPAPQSEPSSGIAQLLTDGSKLSAPEAQQLEQQLTRDPEDLAARAKLIAYYFMNTIPHPRLEHIFWLIEHHPESEIALYYSIQQISADTSPAQSQLEYERAKTLWLQQVAARGGDTRVLGNAAKFVGESDQFAEEDLLKRAQQIEPSNPQWTKRLADVLVWAIALPPRPAGNPITPPTQPSFTVAAKNELETTTDAALVGTAGEYLTSKFVGGNQAALGRNEFAELLLERARVLDPGNPEWAEALERLHAMHESSPPQPATMPANGVKRIRVGAQVQESNLIQRFDPSYPPLARQARIQGVVRFTVMIGVDGLVSNLTLVAGHPLLVPAAQEAVKQWIYRPTLLNGDPVEVVTQVDIPFTLPREN
jgi:TonB family protein